VIRLQKRLGESLNDDEASRSKKVGHLLKDYHARSIALWRLKYQNVLPVLACYVGTLWLLNEVYGGAPVAILPFKPSFLFTWITHRGLSGPVNECSLLFFFVVCALGMKDSVNRIFGNEIPKEIPNPLYRQAKLMEGNFFAPKK